MYIPAEQLLPLGVPQEVEAGEEKMPLGQAWQEAREIPLKEGLKVLAGHGLLR